MNTPTYLPAFSSCRRLPSNDSPIQFPRRGRQYGLFLATLFGLSLTTNSLISQSWEEYVRPENRVLPELEWYFLGEDDGGVLPRTQSGEAVIYRRFPAYYSFTVENLNAFTTLDEMRIGWLLRQDAPRMSMRVLASTPPAGEETIPDFRYREEIPLPYEYFDAEGSRLARTEGNEDLPNLSQGGSIVVSLADLDPQRGPGLSFRLELLHEGNRGGHAMPYVEITGTPRAGWEGVTVVRYDFTDAANRAMATYLHPNVSASLFNPMGHPRPEPRVVVTRPIGSYEAVNLRFEFDEGPGSFRDWVVFSGIRDNVMPVDHWVRITEPGGYLNRRGNRLTGSFERQHRGEQPYRVSVDATISGNNISGTVTLTDDNPWNGSRNSWNGTVRGTITPERDLRSRNAINTNASWPRFTGPDGAGNTSQILGLRTISSIDQIRHQWGSEAIDIGQGIGSLNRFATRYTASRKRTGGGSSSPVLVDGKVYLYYSVPNPTVPFYAHRARNNLNGYPGFGRTIGEAAQEMAQQGFREGLFSGDPDELPIANLEKLWEAADDVVICIDATTGQTLWRTSIENVGFNRQHHKDGPYNQTLAVHGERVFAIGSGGWLHALDRHHGEALWHRQVGREHSHDIHAVLAIEEAVIIPYHGNWAAFDPATGVKLWRNHTVNDLHIPAFWRDRNGTPVIIIHGDNRSTLVGLEAMTGELLFSYELPSQKSFVTPRIAGGGRAGNPGNMTVHRSSLITHERDRSDQDAITVYDISTEGLTPRWRWVSEERLNSHRYNPIVVQNRWVVTSPMQRGVMTLDLNDGAVVSEAGGENSQRYTPDANGMLMAMEDIVFAQRDAGHGGIELTLYKIDNEGQLTLLNRDRHMPLASGNGTGSYQRAVMQPVVDGRIFIRERGGIHAYDLRQNH